MYEWTIVPSKRTSLSTDTRYCIYQEPSSLRRAGDRSSGKHNDILDGREIAERERPALGVRDYVLDANIEGMHCAYIAAFNPAKTGAHNSKNSESASPIQVESQSQLDGSYDQDMSWRTMIRCIAARAVRYTQQSTNRMVWNPTKPRNQYNNQPDSNSNREIELRIK